MSCNPDDEYGSLFKEMSSRQSKLPGGWPKKPNYESVKGPKQPAEFRMLDPLEDKLSLAYLPPLSSPESIGRESQVDTTGDNEGLPLQRTSSRRLEPWSSDFHDKTTSELATLIRNRNKSMFQRTGSLCKTLLITAGYLEPPLLPGMTRIRWTDDQGDPVANDVFEYRQGAVGRLLQRMEPSIGVKVTATSYLHGTPNQNYTFRLPGWFRSISSSLSSIVRGRSKSSASLPQHSPQPGASRTSAASSSNPPTQTTELHLMVCMHRSRDLVTLVQHPTATIATDRELFQFLKRQLPEHRSRIKSIMSMRRIQNIYFVKFRLHLDDEVEVRDHDPCCMSSNPFKCMCLPPMGKLAPPTGTGEYVCNRVLDPPDCWPPIMPKHLVQKLNSPDRIPATETWVLDQLPRRTCGALQGAAGKLEAGWGLYYEEGFDVDVFIGVVCILFFSSSLLFVVLWSVLKMDVQGASGVSAYMLTACSILTTWVVSRTRRNG